MGKKVWLVVVLIIVILPVVYYYPSIANKYIENRNSKIDYSCTVDSDCEIKLVGEGMCHTEKLLCVNKDSVSGKKPYPLKNLGEFFKPMRTCFGFQAPPEVCKCEANKCENYGRNPVPEDLPSPFSGETCPLTKEECEKSERCFIGIYNACYEVSQEYLDSLILIKQKCEQTGGTWEKGHGVQKFGMCACALKTGGTAYRKDGIC